MPPRPFEGEPAAPVAPASQPAAAAPRFTTVEGRPVAEGTSTTLVGGAPIGFGGFSIRAVVEVDGDGDADQDALIALVSERELAVGYARRDGERFSQSILARVERGAGCAEESAVTRVLAPDLGLVTHRLACETGARAVHLLVTFGDVARAGPPIVVDAPAADDPFLASLTVSVRPNDVDGDGATDGSIEVEARSRNGASRAESLVVRSLASGMSADLDAVGARVKVLVRSAARDLRRQSARSVRDAAHALAYARALCPEAGAPRIRVGPSAQPCGLGDAMVRGVSTLAAALAKTDRPADVGALIERAAGAGVTLDAAGTTTLGDALATMRSRIVPGYREIASPDGGSIASIAFDVDGSLRVEGTPPGRVAMHDPFVFEPLEALAGSASPAAPATRYGNTFLVRRDGTYVAIAAPSGDAGTYGGCVFDDAASRIACQRGGNLIVGLVGSAGSPR